MADVDEDFERGDLQGVREQVANDREEATSLAKYHVPSASPADLRESLRQAVRAFVEGANTKQDIDAATQQWLAENWPAHQRTRFVANPRFWKPEPAALGLFWTLKPDVLVADALADMLANPRKYRFDCENFAWFSQLSGVHAAGGEIPRSAMSFRVDDHRIEFITHMNPDDILQQPEIAVKPPVGSDMVLSAKGRVELQDAENGQIDIASIIGLTVWRNEHVIKFGEGDEEFFGLGLEPGTIEQIRGEYAMQVLVETLEYVADRRIQTIYDSQYKEAPGWQTMETTDQILFFTDRVVTLTEMRVVNLPA